MNKDDFIGRTNELEQLTQLTRKKTASLVVVRGRRRIGKSYLLDHFCQNKRVYKFVGLPPTKETNAQSQRDEFSKQLSRQTGLPEVSVDDWSKLFLLLARESQQGAIIIIFDEISWLGDQDPHFLGQLKTAWDEAFKKNPKLLFIMCSSVSTWLDENILSHTGFYGRISLTLSLAPLSLHECNQFLHKQGFKGSDHEKFKLLSVMGGIPWYLEHIQGRYSADDNIKHLCFTEGAILVDEFDRIFQDIFAKRDTVYKNIVSILATGPCSYEALADKTNYKSSGRFSDYLNDLVNAGFISRDYTWQLKSGKETRISQFRLSDNYLRFYLKYIQPRRKLIANKRYQDVNMSTLPAWETVMGLQFENLVLANRNTIIKLLNIRPEDIIADNPFIQTAKSQQQGCQIDYLIQTKYNNLYLCEIRFSKKPLTTKVVADVEEKIKRLVKPRGSAILPVLIHVNGVSDKILAADLFYEIIDFARLLT